MATQGVPLWSTTAATNATADPAVNWAEGQAPSSVNDSARAMMASVAKWRNDLYGITTGGTATAFTVTTSATYATAAVMSGAVFTIIPHATSGAAATLAVDSLTARALNIATGVAIPTGALILGTPYLVKYVHASTEFIVLGALSKNLLTAVDIIGGTSFSDLAVDDTLPAYDLSATANKRILVSDFLKVINVLTADATPDGAADYVMTYDNSAAAAKKVLLQNLPGRLPKGYISGCTLSNAAGDTTNDIAIAAGVCRDSTNAFDITCTAKTKQLDANWAPGSAAGGRNSAIGIANVTYHVFAVAKADGTSDYYFYTGPTAAAALTALQAESGGALYIYARRIGSIMRSGAAIVQFTQLKDTFLLNVLIRSLSLNNPGTAAVAPDLDVPNGFQFGAIVDVNIWRDTGGVNPYVLVTSPDETNSVPTSSLYDMSLVGVVPLVINSSRREVRTNTSGEIRARLSASDTTIQLQIFTRGWRDYFED